MSKNNPDLTAEQKLILFEEGTERPGLVLVSLMMKKEKEVIIVLIVE